MKLLTVCFLHKELVNMRIVGEWTQTDVIFCWQDFFLKKGSAGKDIFHLSLALPDKQ